MFRSVFRRNLHIRTEVTPNQHALKFLPSVNIVPNGRTIEFLNKREASESSLARKLFAIQGIKSVMFGGDFITVEKVMESEWPEVRGEVFAVLSESLTSGEAIVSKELLAELEEAEEQEDDIVGEIKELIVTRIRPAIQEDGGDIDFVDFEADGTVVLRLRGACRSCDSSSVTLKNGIESMLKYYIEEVKNVRQLED